ILRGDFAVGSVRVRLDKAVEIGGGLVTAIDFTSREGEGRVSRFCGGDRRVCIARLITCNGAEAVNENLKPYQKYVTKESIKACSFGGGIGQVGVYIAVPTSNGAPRGGEINALYSFDMSSVWIKSLSIKAKIAPIYDLLPRLSEMLRIGVAQLGWLVGIEDVPDAYD
ncbi:hypothetical protein V8F06_011839, partial [Rhypophila decipiens]